MLRPLTLLLSACLAVAPAAFAVEPLSQRGILLDRVVAVVNDGILLQSQLEFQTAMIVQQLRAQGSQLPPQEVLEQQVLEQLIVEEVQMQRAQRLGVRVPDGMLNSALARVAERNGMSLSELPAAMASQGVDYTRYREDMRREMTLEALHQRDVVAKITVSDREIERFLEREEANAGDQVDFDLSHILIAVPSSATPQDLQGAEEKISMIHDRLIAGESFVELAVAHSDGQNALDGGNLGWRKGAQLPSSFFDVVRDLEPGQFSTPVRSPSGFHILMVNDVRGAEQIIVLQTHTRHILMRPNEILDDQVVRQKLTQIRERIQGGEDFGDIARLESEDVGSAMKGGDLGWTSPGTFVPIYEDTVARMAPGQLSEPIRTDFGWHLIELLDRKERDTTEEVKRDRAIQAIRAGKQEQETEIWLRQLRDEAYVEIRG